MTKKAVLGGVTIHWTGLLDWTTGLTFDTKTIARMAIEFGV